MDISIVIPNYNGEELLKQNLPKVLESVRDYRDGQIEIIIPDDASQDNSVQIIQEFIDSFKDTHIIGKTIHNIDRAKSGFSNNVNRGAKIATGDILVLLNSDVIPHKGFLDPLLKHFSDGQVFAVGCMDESIEGGKTVLRGRGIGKWERGFLFHNAGALDKTNTLWVSGGSGAFRKNMWDKLGGLNELFNPFYWEDIDLSYRAQKVGWKTLFEKQSIVVHEHSKGVIKTEFKQYNVQKIVYRNQFTFVWANITDFSLFVNHLLWLPYHLLNAMRSGNKAFLVGFWTALVRLPETMKYRHKMKKLFIKTDSEVLSAVMD